MSLEVSSASESLSRKKSVPTAEPLVFRSMEQEPNATPLLDNLSQLAEPIAEEAFDLEASLRAAHDQGHREAMEAAMQTLQQRLHGERETLSRFVLQFEQEKRRYFSDVEQEVIKLSLAIAERVLRRESEMDPTLLAGAARVALEQVADSSEAVLRVSVGEVDRWTQTFGPAAAKGMTIEADEALTQGECVLKTRSGTVQLGMRAQLQEIERGFFELLGRRPTMAAASC